MTVAAGDLWIFPVRTTEKANDLNQLRQFTFMLANAGICDHMCLFYMLRMHLIIGTCKCKCDSHLKILHSSIVQLQRRSEAKHTDTTTL